LFERNAMPGQFAEHETQHCFGDFLAPLSTLIPMILAALHRINLLPLADTSTSEQGISTPKTLTNGKGK
jgi:hypothetical protein